MRVRVLRRDASARKAHACYIESGGKRGFLRTVVVAPDTVKRMGLNPATTMLYRNSYVLLEEVPHCETQLRELVEKYDPATQAIVVIEYAPGEKPVMELVNLRSLGAPSRATVQ